MTINWEQFAANLKRARVSAGLTQKQLGAKVGRTGQAIGAYEDGRNTQALRIGVLLKIANACDMDPLLILTLSLPIVQVSEPTDEELDRMALRMMGQGARQ